MDLDGLLEDLRRDQVVLHLLVEDEHDARDHALPRLLQEPDDDDGDGADVAPMFGIRSVIATKRERGAA